MFRVLICLEEFARSESLTEACRLFIKEIQQKIKIHCMFRLYETCMVEAEYDGVKVTLKLYDIAQFSQAIGILNERGVLVDKPVLNIPADIERQVFVEAKRDSLRAYLAKKVEGLNKYNCI